MGALEALKENAQKRSAHIIVMGIFCSTLAACGGGGGIEEASTQNAEAAGSERQQALAADNSTTATGAWTEVAEEGSVGYLQNTKKLRYGVSGKWITKQVKGSFTCDTATFGSDPAPGVSKTCEAFDGTRAGVVRLAWQASRDSAVVGYKVYYGTVSKSYLQPVGGGISANQQVAFTVAGLPAGISYYFAVTAVDASGNESLYSNEASTLLE